MCAVSVEIHWAGEEKCKWPRVIKEAFFSIKVEFFLSHPPLLQF